MTVEGNGRPPAEDIIFRLRAKMEDNSYQILKDGDRNLLAYRVEGEDIDLLRSLEFLSEFLQPDAIEEVSDLVIISDRNFQTTPVDMIIPKLEVKKGDDERLFKELKESLRRSLEPLTFTMENDILELYRIAIRVEGSQNRTDDSVGLDLLKIDLPKEGDVVYLIFKDGYRKMSRSSFESLVENSLSSLRQGPSLMKDPPKASFSRRGTIDEKLTYKEKPKNATRSKVKAPEVKKKPIKDLRNDPKMVARELSKEMASLGYRKDTMFSRNDVNQFFFISMKGPAVFLKIIEERDELESFLRVLSHRKDALGLLISKDWDPRLEAISRINGFIYMEIASSERASAVIREILREGGGN